MSTKKKKESDFVYNVLPDTLDFRDQMYLPTLVEVPVRIDLSDYQAVGVPILDQGKEGACTGFGLATVAHYLLRRRRVVPDEAQISPRMFYEMARRYDEWPGEDYDGSSARGAMKGWHKHGVCAKDFWPDNPRQGDRRLNNARARDAVSRPLGAYFRVNHKDIVAMHSALAEVGILYAGAVVHAGWHAIQKDSGVIPLQDRPLGGHAFAIVAYDARGFWIQNSWGAGWGLGGFALITYDDWLVNGNDVWVARLGAPVELQHARSTAIAGSATAKSGLHATPDLRPHIISIGNDGLLRTNGTYGTSEEDVEAIVTEDFQRISANWQKKRILLYAHGGLTDEASAIQRVADYRTLLLDAEVYPIAFIWKTDFWTTLTNILKDAVRKRRPEGMLDSAKDFMLDRADDFLEPVARMLGKAQWDEMKENGLGATVESKGGARILLQHLAAACAADPTIEVHVAGHSAGSIFHAPLIQMLTTAGPIPSGPMKGKRGHGVNVASCTLWAPAITVDLFKQTYLPAIQSGKIGRFAISTLTDAAEQSDHCGSIYNKSLLYLVSNALEEKGRIPLLRDGTPILGMEKFIRADPGLKDLMQRVTAKKMNWVRSPNNAREGSPDHATSKSHGGFDDDGPTLLATLARILGTTTVKASFTPHRSAASLRNRRIKIG